MKRVLLSLLCLGFVSGLWAQSYERLTKYEEDLYGRRIHVSGSFEAMRQIRQYWGKEYERLNNNKCQMVLCGNGEGVLKVTIPSRLLFQANDSAMLTQADGMLRPFLRLLRGKDALASVLVACYSDNNGSDNYLKGFSLSRAEAVSQWLRRQGVTAKVSTYGIGNHAPLNENSNIAEREQNRRVSLFLVPNKQMLRMAKKGTLN